MVRAMYDMTNVLVWPKQFEDDLPSGRRTTSFVAAQRVLPRSCSGTTIRLIRASHRDKETA
jgi:hypothetical protein